MAFVKSGVACCACRADEVIVSSEEDVVARVKDITGRKMAYAALDCVAGEMTDTVAASTREDGTVYVRVLSMSMSGEIDENI